MDEEGKTSPVRRILIIAAAGALLAAGALAFLAFRLNASPGKPFRIPPGSALRDNRDGSATILIKDGDTADSIGRLLAEAGIISHPLFWKLLFRLDRGFIKTGVYRLEPNATQREIKEILVAGRQIPLRITLPEGITLKKTAELLEEAGICGAEDFLLASRDPELLAMYQIPGETMEGYLYPDTYFFTAAFPAQDLVKTLADTFFLRLRELDQGALELSPQELYDKVILASIVEREYRLDEEAPLMAGVFNNRLEIGMALQSCATVEYVITEIEGRPHPTALYDRDTEIENPYNTYIHPGLPPGPIAAPGNVALRAAFNPEKSEYLYFRLVNPEEGRHYFSKTFDEHIRAGALYVKGSAR